MKKRGMTAFLVMEAALFACILTSGGVMLAVACFASILLCGFYGWAGASKSTTLLCIGLLCTVCADFCLVVCTPMQQLWGMVFFLGAQTMYAFYLSRGKKKHFWWVRLSLSFCALALTVAVLREKTDALALVSVCYYANLILNLVQAMLRKDGMLATAFVFFLLCDTIIGLQAASGVYLTIEPGTALYRILFCGFNLAWFFYLPSQVLIALRTAGGWKK